jgi:hypothetical protein
LPLASLARRLREGTLRAGDINGFLDIEPGARRTVPLVNGTASCGFPSPAYPAARCHGQKCGAILRDRTRRAAAKNDP